MDNEPMTNIPDSNGSDKNSALISCVEKINGSVEGLLGKFFGLVGRLPWEKWLKTANRFVVALLPAIVALVGILGCLVGAIFYINMDARFSVVMGEFKGIILSVFALLVMPKALELAQSVVKRGEPDVLRPEFLYVIKLIGGLGCLVYGVLSLDVACIATGIFVIICTECPAIGNFQPGIPHNCVEEICSIFLFPVRVAIAMLPLIIASSVVYGFVKAITTWCSYGTFGMAGASLIMQGTAAGAVLAPILVYFLYLLAVFCIDLYKAVASIPHKFDELKREVRQ